MAKQTNKVKKQNIKKKITIQLLARTVFYRQKK